MGKKMTDAEVASLLAQIAESRKVKTELKVPVRPYTVTPKWSQWYKGGK
jgi:hypothetical protein